MPRREPAVYIMASGRKGTLYTGVSSDLAGRVAKHKLGEYEGFTSKYSVTELVYFEFYPDMHAAILREKQIKKWNRAWKIELIESMNPTWRDLFEEL